MIRSYNINNYKSGRASRTYEVVNKITEYLESQLLEGINEGFFMETDRDLDNCYKKDFDNKNQTIFIDSQSILF